MSHKAFQYILVLIFIFGVNCDDPEVEIPQGRLRGGTRTNRDGGTYFSFQGIPYGKPPVGERRFRIAEPAEGWEGTRDATQEAATCTTSSTSGQEDCLFLNIYTPELPSENTDLKPTMVFIHGGAFTGGSAAESSFGAAHLLTKDVLLVVIQYRLGVFGFLSLDDPNLGVTGNAGLKDQVLALKWIQENIEHFGGDPDNVLIFGQSAGSMSVHLHILSPMSQGLFSKAIGESGVAISKTTYPEMRNNALALAEELGIQTENWEDMILAMQSLSSEDLASAGQALTRTYRYFCRPIVEVESVEPVFMPQNAIDIMKSGSYNQVPYLLGSNNAEEGNENAVTDFTQYIPEEFEIEADSEAAQDIIERIKDVYGTDTTGAVYLATDFFFGFPAYRTALEQAKNALYPIYFYYFSTITELNYSKLQNPNSFPGAMHNDELSYIFFSSRTPAVIEEGSLEDLAIKNMVALWTNFATYGNPTPDGFDYTWVPVQDGVVNYLHIDTGESSSKVNLNPERMQLWLDLYAEYSP